MPPADTVACCGMARAAEWLYREVRGALIALPVKDVIFMLKMNARLGGMTDSKF